MQLLCPNRCLARSFKEQVPQVDVGGGGGGGAAGAQASGHVSSQVKLSSSSNMEVKVKERWLIAALMAAHKQDDMA